MARPRAENQSATPTPSPSVQWSLFETEAPAGYEWRHGETCHELSFVSASTTRYESLREQTVKGMVEHTGGENKPVKNVKVCAGDVCTSVNAGVEMHRGDNAHF